MNSREMDKLEQFQLGQFRFGIDDATPRNAERFSLPCVAEVDDDDTTTTHRRKHVHKAKTRWNPGVTFSRATNRTVSGTARWQAIYWQTRCYPGTR